MTHGQKRTVIRFKFFTFFSHGVVTTKPTQICQYLLHVCISLLLCFLHHVWDHLRSNLPVVVGSTHSYIPYTQHPPPPSPLFTNRYLRKTIHHYRPRECHICKSLTSYVVLQTSRTILCDDPTWISQTKTSRLYSGLLNEKIVQRSTTTWQPDPWYETPGESFAKIDVYEGKKHTSEYTL